MGRSVWLFLYLIIHANRKTGTLYLRINTISRDIGISPRTVQIWLKTLRDVFVCDNMAFSGDFSPLLHKHTSNLNLTDSIAVAVDRIYRGFDSIANQIRSMREFSLADNDARLRIYRAFVERLIKGVPRQLMPTVHENYFDTAHESFRSRNLWSLSNAFTSAFKSLGPLKQFEATAKLGTYMSKVRGEVSGKSNHDDNHTDLGDSARKPLVDCGTGRFRLVKGEKGELKEETIEGVDRDWGGIDDQIDEMVNDEAAAKAAA